MVFLKQIFALFLSIISLFNIFDGGGNEVPKTVRKQPFTYLQYPAEAVKTLEEWGLSESQFISRATNGSDEYSQARGYTDANGIIISPYFNLYVNNTEIPVYSTTVYLGISETGALHSFAEVYVKEGSDFTLSFQLNSKGFTIRKAQLVPQNSNLSLLSYKDYILNAKVSGYGTYNFVFNEDDQKHSFTLFVREDYDEEKEIADLKSQYGENNVIVVEGLLEMPYYSVRSSGTVIYLKKGAYVKAIHQFDINNSSDESLYDEGANKDNGIGLTRYPFLNYHTCQNLKLLGYGAFDMTQLDRRERRGIVFTNCKDIQVRGIKIINAPEWSFITYDCENVDIDYTDVFGYRMNSDAFAICNSRNVTVDKCFARSGDDLFDVKSLGGAETAVSRNVHFNQCIAWAGKARCFGICGEVEKLIDNVSFRNCDVVFHDAIWNADRIPAISIVVEVAGGSISNVTFENINVYKAYNRAIGCVILENGISNFNISNIVYRNISYNSELKDKVYANASSNRISVEYDNVYANGNRVNPTALSSFIEYDSNSTISVK